MKQLQTRPRIEEVWYGTSPAARVARTALAPLSLVFGGAVAVRGFLYDRGLIAVGRAALPVISVGGLSVGGAGKTPFVLWLAGRLRERGHRPCIVTRGYGGVGGDLPVVLTAEDAADPEAVARCGDEAVLLALRSGCPVVVGPDRRAACELALTQAPSRSANLFLLDDGFQHRALARDLDIVMIRGDEAGSCVLPAGPLRERPSALARAGAVVTMEEEGGASMLFPGMSPADGFDWNIGGRATLQLKARVRPSLLVSKVTDSEGDAVSALAGRRVALVAAIARPERFVAAIEAAGATIHATLLRPDHHRYDAGERREIAAIAAAADLVVTTEKDLVKLSSPSESSRVRALRIELEVEGGGPLLDLVDALAPFDR